MTTARWGWWCVAMSVALSLSLAGCSREDTTVGTIDTAGEPAVSAPAPFDDGPVAIAIVRNSDAGDASSRWLEGARDQADTVGFEVEVFDAASNNDRQVADMQGAIDAGVSGIIVDGGRPEVMCPVVVQALDAGMAVVSYDLDLDDCAPDAVVTRPADGDATALVLGRMLQDVGTGVDIGYVNVLGPAALGRRHAAWERSRAANDWGEAFFVGVLTDSLVADNAELVGAALDVTSEMAAVFAPSEAFARAATSAIAENETRVGISVYGVGISDAAIAAMVGEDSPWAATAAFDPYAEGAAVVRTLALELAGGQPSGLVEFPGVLVTRSDLMAAGVATLAELRSLRPELDLSEVSSADWIAAVP